MRISDWSSDVCSSNLRDAPCRCEIRDDRGQRIAPLPSLAPQHMQREIAITELKPVLAAQRSHRAHEAPALGFTAPALRGIGLAGQRIEQRIDVRRDREPEMLEIVAGIDDGRYRRSEEHTSELQSLMRISYAVF